MAKFRKEIIKRETFVDWDFENDWTIFDGDNYPKLRRCPSND